MRRVAFQDGQEAIDGETARVGTEGIEAFGHFPCSWVDELGHAIDVKELTSKIGREIILAVDINDGANVGPKDVDDAGRGFIGLQRNEYFGAPLGTRFTSEDEVVGGRESDTRPIETRLVGIERGRAVAEE